jgi:hypothetical protein
VIGHGKPEAFRHDRRDPAYSLVGRAQSPRVGGSCQEGIEPERDDDSAVGAAREHGDETYDERRDGSSTQPDQCDLLPARRIEGLERS